MGISVELDLGYEFTVKAAIKEVYDLVSDVPLPALMKMVVVPVVQAEFEKLVEKYIDNLIREFGGEV